MLFDRDTVNGDVYAKNGNVVVRFGETETIMSTEMAKRMEMKLSEARQKVHNE